MRPEDGADMRGSFFGSERPLLTVMVQADNPERIKALMAASAPEGADAFGIQLERMKKEFKTEEVLKSLFTETFERPVYVTNYRICENVGKTDEELATELIGISGMGADLVDVMGDLFDRQPDEMARSSEAIKKQEELISAIHEKGAKVLMSAHVSKFTPAERVIEIAKEQEKRGADICKIVTGASSMEEQAENLKITAWLKKELKVPFLFLAGGECSILRRVGGHMGSCMYLCVYEHDSFATLVQPLLSDVKTISDILNNRG